MGNGQDQTLEEQLPRKLSDSQRRGMWPNAEMKRISLFCQAVFLSDVRGAAGVHWAPTSNLAPQGQMPPVSHREASFQPRGVLLFCSAFLLFAFA